MAVYFDIHVNQEGMSSCGLKCREVSVTLKNMGDEVAHDVNVTAEFFCKDRRVEVNKKRSQELYVGTIEPGSVKEETFKLEVGLRDSLCIKSSGVKVFFTITSREKRKKIEKMFHL